MSHKKKIFFPLIVVVFGALVAVLIVKARPEAERRPADTPDPVVRISESGLRTRAVLESLQRVGYHGFLIGESLVRAADPGAALRELIG